MEDDSFEILLLDVTFIFNMFKNLVFNVPIKNEEII